MPTMWKPSPGQVALIEMSPDTHECLTGVVLETGGAAVAVDLGASGRPSVSGCEVVASFFAPDALYRLTATLELRQAEAVVDLTVHGVERVQRRATPRAPLVLPIVLSNFDDPGPLSGEFTSVVGESVDVGEGGCRVRVRDAFPAGCDPTVTLHMPDGSTVVALAAVLQSTAVTWGYEYRLVFLSVEDDDRVRLKDAIDFTLAEEAVAAGLAAKARTGAQSG